MRTLFTKLLSFLAITAMIMLSSANAQTVQVTFRVNMSEVGEISPLGVHIAGNFQGWNPGSTEMIQPPFGFVYTYTQDFAPGSELEFKYINGNDWGMDESVPNGCAQGGNRNLTVPDEDITLDVVCFGSCTICNPPQVDITFQVDMSNETVSPNGIHIAGSFQGWDPAGTPLTLKENDIYEVTLSLGEGEYHEYKFINGNAWGDDETVPPDCAFGFNRYFWIPGVSTTLDAVCFGNCDPCGPPPVDVEITFKVDMSQQQVSPDGVHIGGAFQGWDPGATLMTNEGGGIYSYTGIFPSGTYQEYKFVNGITWEDAEILPEDCNNSGNRYFNVPDVNTELDLVCFGLCGPCPAPQEVDVTFQVDMSEQTVSEDGVHLMGTFNDFTPQINPLTDQGEGIWSTTITLIENDVHEYAFVNGLTETEDVPLACANTNGYRELMVPGVATTLGLVCFGSCDPCVPPPTVDVTFQVDMSNEEVSPEGVFIVGTFQDWSLATDEMTLTENNIYTYTATFVVGEQIEFKYVNGITWDDAELIPGACVNNDGNRTLTVPDVNTTLDLVCFASCNPCVVPVDVNVTFRVDMSNEDVSADGVHVAGSFNGFSPEATEMLPERDGVYSATVVLTAGDHVTYKYINGNTFAGEEIVPEACGEDNGFGGFNRYIDIPENDTIIDVVCFGTCEPCIPPAEVDVTFQVDMSEQTVAPEGIHVAGTFNFFSTTETPMTDMGNGIWAVTLTLTEGDYIMYKFVNGNTFQGFETVPAECAQEDGNRELTVPGEALTLDPVCFGACGPCIPPPTVDVTFQVDMSNEEVSQEGVFIVGSFQDWSLATDEMTLTENNIYTYTATLVVGEQIEFKYVNGITWDDAELIPGACVNNDGNRTLTVPDVNTTLDLVCFASCNPCVVPVDVNVTFRVDMSNEDVSADGVHVAGSFNGFSPEATEMLPERDGVYSATVVLTAGDHVTYKYINGNTFAGEEIVPEACGEDNGFGGFNRYIDIPENDTIIDVVCFGTCTECIPLVDVEVTFQVDMSNEIVSQDGVHVAGSFNGFDPAATPLTDQGGGIYTTTVTLTAGDHTTYKYINGTSYDYQETVPADCGEDDGFGGYNRYVDVPETNYEIPVHCFSSCDVCVALTHEIMLFEGWNSLSSYLMPGDNDILTVMDEISSQLVILQTMTEVYFPEGGLNTIQTWDSQSAYKIKVTEDVTLNITGTPEQNKTLQLEAGWNLMPVISDTPVDVESLFMDVIEQVIVVKGIAETGILWPEYNINTLGTLLPGKSYFIKTSEAIEVIFP